MNSKRNNRIRRHKRIRSKIAGTATRPRLSVSRSHRSLYVQLIDDAAGRTLIALHSARLPSVGGKKKYTKRDMSREVGRLIATRAGEQQIRAVVFDRGGYRYQGRVRAFAEGAREGGLVF